MLSPHISTPSTPELVPTIIPSVVQRTNTLVITSLPRPYLQPGALEALHTHFADFGELYKWAPLTGFARVLVVYYLEDDAERAKEYCDNLTIGPFPQFNLPQFTMRVFRHETTSLTQDDGEGNHYLRPPAHEKNFLISPPGSPPVGWEQIREDPPNSSPLAEDLISALRKLQIHQGRHNESGVEILIEADEAEAGIAIYVEDCDMDLSQNGDNSGSDWVYGEPSPSRPNWKPIPTAMPPMRVHA